ncbi:MAG TPA: C45 family peptidase, partial [Nitrososphaeraceae archaeon]|nr:C45 family peptidase [Nitrososphaeraceae archaeon]
MNQIGDLPIVYLEGSPRERGLYHGRALGDAIHDTLRLEREAHGVEEKDWNTILGRVDPYREYLEKEHPDLFQELEGIASGAITPLNAIILINEGADNYWNQGCSTLVVEPAATLPRHILVGKNRDGPYLRLKTDALFVVFPKNRPSYITIAGVGTLARDGINEYGLALFGNGLAGPNDDQGKGIAFAGLRRYLLAQSTVSSIQATLEQLPRRSSFNYTIASAVGTAIA